MIVRYCIRILVRDQYSQVGHKHTFEHTREKKSMHNKSKTNGLKLIIFNLFKG